MRLEARGLVRVFPDGTRALDGADLELRTPCFMVLSGPNGSGKTVLARHFVGLERPQAGSVLADGIPVERCLAETRRRVGFVFQEPEHQILGITAGEDVEFGIRGRVPDRKERRRRALRALQNAGLAGSEDRLASALSGGQKRRLAVASALVSDPELIILDEPFNGLDPAGASGLLRVLLSLRDRGVGILLVTHDLEKCLAHADRLAVLDSGRVTADGPPAELWNRLPSLGLRRPPGGSDRLGEMTWLNG